MTRPNLQRYARLSVLVSLLVIGLKIGAYALTGSVGLLSDALESLTNVAAALIALIVLGVAVRPPDDEHNYGHDKAEYFASAAEGALILIAALSIGFSALDRLFNPHPLEQLDLGLAVSLLATLINGLTARTLAQVGKRHGSITLEADAKHLMTDVYTSLGVVVGLVLVALTGLLWLDSVVALLVALHIVASGAGLLHRSAHGMMDSALSAQDVQAVQSVLDSYAQRYAIQHHALRTRQAGPRKFISVHVLVPDAWTVKRGHDLLEQLEGDIRNSLGRDYVNVSTHLEPLNDPCSHRDSEL
ncbi:MAG: cation diffusion facilitator family transporter [Anaerolineae bacterium]|nr:cation diffusion facilitator family transporter [Anaerolineae bacterium]MDW8173477.1 cation diffusion facilitator family transporter [Anaerolineae bacterium]